MRSVVFLRGNIIEGANQNAATHKSRYRYLDALKVYEIITVVFAHCMTYSFDWRETNEFVYYLRYFLTGAISFCIPTFFIVNGFLLFNHTLDCKKHYIKTLKLVILTVVWGVLYLLVLQPIRGETLTVGELIKGLYTLKNGWINFLWYLGALVCIYIFFPILKFAFDSSNS